MMAVWSAECCCCLQGNPPTPDSKSVKIIHSNTTKVYVHRFGGWAISWVVGHEIHHLAMALKEEGVSSLKPCVPGHLTAFTRLCDSPPT